MSDATLDKPMGALSLKHLAMVGCYFLVLVALGYLTTWWSFLFLSFAVGWVWGERKQRILYTSSLATGLLWGLLIGINDWRFHGRLSMRMAGVLSLPKAVLLYLAVVILISVLALFAAQAGRFWSRLKS